jgi:HEAT repeat protein
MPSDPFKSVDPALIAIGPAAEAAVIAQLRGEPFTVRQRACEILGRIGTHETLRAMQALPADSNGLVRNAANAAMAAIVARHGPLPGGRGRGN